jgi:hypothetical protein
VKMREDMVLHKKLLCKDFSGGVFASLGNVILLLSTRFITLVCNKQLDLTFQINVSLCNHFHISISPMFCNVFKTGETFLER